MMSLSAEQYMSLSGAVYSDFNDLTSKIKQPTINELLMLNKINGAHYDHETDKVIYSSDDLVFLDELRDYTLIDYRPNTSTGFSGAAFQAPNNPDGTKGEIIFAFRGTEGATNLQDVLTDWYIFSNKEAPQYYDAVDFVNKVLSEQSYSTYEITGHSLGGALAQYVAYSKKDDPDFKGGTTFNSPGIAQILGASNDDLIYFRGMLTEYANADDVIGSFGKQLGLTVYIEGNISNTGVNTALAGAALSASLDSILIHGILIDYGPIGGVISVGTLVNALITTLTAYNMLSENDKRYLQQQMNLKAHGMDTMLERNSEGKYLMIGRTVSSSDAELVINQLQHTDYDDDYRYLQPGASVVHGDAVNIDHLGNILAPDPTRDEDDHIYASADAAHTDAGGGNDWVTGSSQYDIIYGSAGNDFIEGLDKNDELYGGIGNDILIDGRGNDYVEGQDGKDIILLGSGTDIALGGDGNDIISDIWAYDFYFSDHIYVDYLGSNRNIWSDLNDYNSDINLGDHDDDYMSGGLGNDTILSAYGDDVLDGGRGNDWLVGGKGSNQFLFGRGYGEDLAEDRGTTTGFDQIKMLQDINTNDIDVINQLDGSFTLRIRNTKDQITAFMNSTLGHLSEGIEEVAFQNDMKWNYSDILSASKHRFDSYDEDVMIDYDASTFIYGLDGDDKIDAGRGDDTVYGGEGNDNINGGEGSDTIYGDVGDDMLSSGIEASYSAAPRREEIHGGDGNDKIYGYAGEEVYLYGDAGDDKIELKTSQRQPGFGTIDGGDGNDSIDLAGAKGSYEIFGGSGNDRILGGLGVNRINGGTGDDDLEGSRGISTFVFNESFGTDVLHTKDSIVDKNYLEFQNYDIADVVFWRNKNDLHIFTPNGEDHLTIEGYFKVTIDSLTGDEVISDNNRIQDIKFRDGSVNYSDIIAGDDQIIKITDYLNSDNGTTYYGSQFNETFITDSNNTYTGIYGYGGNDEFFGTPGVSEAFYGGSGNDTLDAKGAGPSNSVRAEVLSGGIGNDIYYYGKDYGYTAIQDEGRSYDQDLLSIGYLPSDILEVHEWNDDMYILFKSNHPNYNTNILALWDYIDNPSNRIERFEFANGTRWTDHDLRRLASGLYTGDGTDNVVDYSLAELGHNMKGLAGNDTMIGSSAVDYLEGGTGNDRLEGGIGGDVYYFNVDDGQDTIKEMFLDNQDKNIIKLGEGIFEDNIDAFITGSDLVLKLNNSGDEITVENYWPNGFNNNSLEIFFNNGSIWRSGTIYYSTLTQKGTENSDTLYGVNDISYGTIKAYGGDDIIYSSNVGSIIFAGDGNDTIFGADSYADEVDGGSGNDFITGGANTDLYYFGWGDGHDTIQEWLSEGATGDSIRFKKGVRPSDVVFEQQGLDLVIKLKRTTDQDSSDSMRFIDYYGYIDVYTGTSVSSGAPIESIMFMDDYTVWSSEDLAIKIPSFTTPSYNIYGSQEDDTLYGSYYEDTIYGYDGNDKLYALGGNNTLYGGLGDDYYSPGIYNSTSSTDDGGNDTYEATSSYGYILDYGDNSSNDTVLLPSHSYGYVFQQSGDSLMIQGSDGRSLTIQQWFNGEQFRLESIKDTAGNLINSNRVNMLIEAMAVFSANNNGMTWSQALTSKPTEVQDIVSQYWTASTS